MSRSINSAKSTSIKINTSSNLNDGLNSDNNSHKEINDIELHECSFIGQFTKAKINLRFPCLFFIQWKSSQNNNNPFIKINRYNSTNHEQILASTKSKYRAVNGVVEFNQKLQIKALLKYNKRLSEYEDKQTIVRVNLVSVLRPLQGAKLVGQVVINLGKVMNYSGNQGYKCCSRLSYCSVDAELMYQIKVTNVNNVTTGYSGDLYKIQNKRIRSKDNNANLMNEYYPIRAVRENSMSSQGSRRSSRQSIRSFDRNNYVTQQRVSLIDYGKRTNGNDDQNDDKREFSGADYYRRVYRQVGNELRTVRSQPSIEYVDVNSDNIYINYSKNAENKLTTLQTLPSSVSLVEQNRKLIGSIYDMNYNKNRKSDGYIVIQEEECPQLKSQSLTHTDKNKTVNQVAVNTDKAKTVTSVSISTEETSAFNQVGVNTDHMIDEHNERQTQYIQQIQRLNLYISQLQLIKQGRKQQQPNIQTEGWVSKQQSEKQYTERQQQLKKQLNQLKIQIETYHEQKLQRQFRQQQWGKQIGKREQKVVSLEEKIFNLQAIFKELNKEILALNTQISKSNAQISKNNAQLSQSNTQRLKLNRQIENLYLVLDNKQRAIIELNNQILTKEAAIAQLRNDNNSRTNKKDNNNNNNNNDNNNDHNNDSSIDIEEDNRIIQARSDYFDALMNKDQEINQQQCPYQMRQIHLQHSIEQQPSIQQHNSSQNYHSNQSYHQQHQQENTQQKYQSEQKQKQKQHSQHHQQPNQSSQSQYNQQLQLNVKQFHLTVKQLQQQIKELQSQLNHTKLQLSQKDLQLTQLKDQLALNKSQAQKQAQNQSQLKLYLSQADHQLLTTQLQYKQKLSQLQEEIKLKDTILDQMELKVKQIYELKYDLAELKEQNQQYSTQIHSYQERIHYLEEISHQYQLQIQRIKIQLQLQQIKLQQQQIKLQEQQQVKKQLKHQAQCRSEKQQSYQNLKILIIQKQLQQVKQKLQNLQLDNLLLIQKNTQAIEQNNILKEDNKRLQQQNFKSQQQTEQVKRQLQVLREQLIYQNKETEHYKLINQNLLQQYNTQTTHTNQLQLKVYNSQQQTQQLKQKLQYYQQLQNKLEQNLILQDKLRQKQRELQQSHKINKELEKQNKTISEQLLHIIQQNEQQTTQLNTVEHINEHQRSMTEMKETITILTQAVNKQQLTITNNNLTINQLTLKITQYQRTIQYYKKTIQLLKCEYEQVLKMIKHKQLQCQQLYQYALAQ